MKNKKSGQILPIVMVTLLVLTIIIAGLVTWIQNDTNWSVKQEKSSSAVSLAEAAIDRGTWKLQSTTATWTQASLGIVIPNYNFDKTFTDIPGGTYRIRFSSGIFNTKPSVTITAEGRDNSTKDVRAISALFINQTIYSPLMAGGNVSWAQGLGVFWGPIMSQGDIQLQDDVVGAWYFPRKFAKGVVIGPPSGNFPRDTNGLALPNTDNVEWWSEYAGVPNVPILDFAALRSSAAASGTLNVYGCRSTQGGAGTLGSATKWDTRATCGTTVTPHSQHFGNPWSHPLSPRLNANNNFVWYWDGDVTLSGAYCGAAPGTPCNESTGLRGTIVVMGNLTIDTPGEYNYTGHVPALAWQEENKLTKTTFDTAATREYPADIGLHLSTGIFNFGTDTWNQPLAAQQPWATTVGIRGFTYVNKNLTIQNFMDFNGAVWINGTVIATGGTANSFCGIFYDDTLSVPALNVILQRQSWQEVPASNTAWP